MLVKHALRYCHVICISFNVWLWLWILGWFTKLADNVDVMCFSYKKPKMEFVVNCISCICILSKLSHDVLISVKTSCCEMCCLKKIATHSIMWILYTSLFNWLIHFRFSLHQIRTGRSNWKNSSKTSIARFDSYEKKSVPLGVWLHTYYFLWDFYECKHFVLCMVLIMSYSLLPIFVQLKKSGIVIVVL